MKAVAALWSLLLVELAPTTQAFPSPTSTCPFETAKTQQLQSQQNTPTSLHQNDHEESSFVTARDDTDEGKHGSDDDDKATVSAGTTELRLGNDGGFEESRQAGDAYHLLWSPQAWPKFLYTTAGLLLIPKLIGWLTGTRLPLSLSSQTPSCHGGGAAAAASGGRLALVFHNGILPLLASACCLLQLLLNVLAVGCAGWNKVLGPLRPYFLAYLLAASVQPPLPPPLVLLGRSSVALLPEALDAYNHYSAQRQQHRWQLEEEVVVVASSGAVPTAGLSQKDEHAAPAVRRVQHVTLEIPTMGCSACIHAVNGALRNVAGVTAATSELYPLGLKQGGSATVQMLLQKDNNRDALHQSLLEAVANAGFEGATVVESATRQVKV